MLESPQIRRSTLTMILTAPSGSFDRRSKFSLSKCQEMHVHHIMDREFQFPFTGGNHAVRFRVMNTHFNQDETPFPTLPRRFCVRHTSTQLELLHGNPESVSNAIQMGVPPHLGGGRHPAKFHWAHQAPQVYREVGPRASCLDFFVSE